MVRVPTSSSTRPGVSSTRASAVAKRTGCSRWRAQYSGEVAVSASSHSPVAVDTSGSVGAERWIASISASSGGTTGSIIFEWNACEVCSMRQATPSTSNCAFSRSISSAGPEATLDPGAFSAASDNPGVRRASSSSLPIRTVSIPPAGWACISAPRSATRRSASDRENTPAKVAATSSPRLWPIMATGTSPRSIHSRASAYSIEKMAGCITLVGSSAAGSSPNISARRSRPGPVLKPSTHWSKAEANPGSAW